MALVRRFPRRWWAPGAVLVVAYGVVTIWLYPIVIDPVFNKFEPLPNGPAPLRGAPAGRPRRGGRGRGLPGRREPPDQRRERVRDRARAQQARRPLRQPDRRLPARPRCALWWRTSSATRSTTTCCAGSRGSRSWRRRAPSWRRRSPSASRGRRTAAAPRRRCRRSRWRSRWRASGSAARRTRCRARWRRAPTRSRSSSRATRTTSSRFQRRIAVQNVARPRPAGALPRCLFGTHPTTLERIGAGEAFRSK